MTLTEDQKKLFMVLFTIVFCVFVFMLGIKSMDQQIKDNKVKLVSSTEKYDEMKGIIEDTTLEPTYEKLKKESSIKFDQDYLPFKIDPWLLDLLKTIDIEPTALNTAGTYSPLDPSTYEIYIAQPQTKEEYDAMKQTIDGELMPLFLTSSVHIEADTTYEGMLKFIDTINNVPPVGPGEQDMKRYCLQFQGCTLTYGPNNPYHLSATITLYGMVPPPID